MGVEVEVKDNGGTRIKVSLENLTQAVTIGVHEDAPDYPDGTSIIVVAATQELGSDDVPARSYLRGWVDSGGQSVVANVGQAQIGKVVDGAAPATVGVEIGEASVKGVLARMEQGIFGDPDGERRELNRTGHLRDNIEARPVT